MSRLLDDIRSRKNEMSDNLKKEAVDWGALAAIAGGLALPFATTAALNWFRPGISSAAGQARASALDPILKEKAKALAVGGLAPSGVGQANIDELMKSLPWYQRMRIGKGSKNYLLDKLRTEVATNARLATDAAAMQDASYKRSLVDYGEALAGEVAAKNMVAQGELEKARAEMLKQKNIALTEAHMDPLQRIMFGAMQVNDEDVIKQMQRNIQSLKFGPPSPASPIDTAKAQLLNDLVTRLTTGSIPVTKDILDTIRALTGGKK